MRSYKDTAINRPLCLFNNKEITIKPRSIIKPPRLRPGDGVGVIAPAGPVNVSELEAGLNELESAGFEIHLAPSIFARNDYLAGEDDARLADLHSMFTDRKIKAVFCARGGYGSLRLLDKIQYNLIRENPKFIVGYSDITVLLMAVYAKTGLITCHGPMVRDQTFRRKADLDGLLHLLSTGQPLKLNLAESHPLVSGNVRGPLMGGNLSMICHLIGTPFLPSFDNCILFVEEKGEPLYRLDRMLTHLKLSGRINRLSGLIAGQFESCGDIANINRLLIDTAKDLGIPLFTGLPIGHGKKNHALPLGLMAEIDTDQMCLSIIEEASSQ